MNTKPPASPFSCRLRQCTLNTHCLVGSDDVIYSLFWGIAAGYEPLYKAVGVIWCARLGVISFILAALLVPLASLLPNLHAAVLPELFFAMAVNSAADLAAYSGSNVLVRLSL